MGYREHSAALTLTSGGMSYKLVRNLIIILYILNFLVAITMVTITMVTRFSFLIIETREGCRSSFSQLARRGTMLEVDMITRCSVLLTFFRCWF